MPESLLSRRLKLGTFLGIGLYVHWSFSLAVLFVTLRSLSLGWAAVAFGIAQLLGVFFCVTLHEYGHAMAARCFGIGTADITLLPIGGVARLVRMPRIPWQELLVAVAGPAVNVVIAITLVTGFAIFADADSFGAIEYFARALLTGGELDEQTNATAMRILTEPSLLGFGILMIVVNVMLVLFNMIPAFPMDGGRVFRSLLAMTMNYSRATSIASSVGVLCAILMAYAALTSDPPNPIPVLIAAFIGFAGIAESRQVSVMEKVRGFTVADVMIHNDRVLPMDTPLREIARQWQRTTQSTLPVSSIVGTVIGTLRLEDVTAAIKSGKDPNTSAGELIDYSAAAEMLSPDEPLSAALSRTGKLMRQIPVVDASGRLVGILDLDTMLSRRALPQSIAITTEETPRQFDVMT